MKQYSEQELRDLKNVFGEPLTFDENGEVIERGIGSPGQRTVNPTSPPSLAPKAEQIEFVRKCVAASGNAQFVSEFEAYLRWRSANPIERAAVLEIQIDQLAGREGNPIQAERVLEYRAKLRAGSVAPPIRVMRTADNRWRIEDGFHRTHAARDEGYKMIRAEIVPNPPEAKS